MSFRENLLTNLVYRKRNEIIAKLKAIDPRIDLCIVRDNQDNGNSFRFNVFESACRSMGNDGGSSRGENSRGENSRGENAGGTNFNGMTDKDEPRHYFSVSGVQKSSEPFLRLYFQETVKGLVNLRERFVDQMTGMLRKEALYDDFFAGYVYRAYGRSRNQSRCHLCVMMLDLDHFKKVNDTHGHAAGDDVIRTFARIQEECFDLPGLCGRYGGEEFFAVWLGSPDQGHEYCGKVGERLKKEFFLSRAAGASNYSSSGMSVPSVIETFSVTFSAGISGRTLSKSLLSKGQVLSAMNGCFEKADEALYESKKSGRNRCTVSRESIFHPIKFVKSSASPDVTSATRALRRLEGIRERYPAVSAGKVISAESAAALLFELSAMGEHQAAFYTAAVMRHVLGMTGPRDSFNYAAECFLSGRLSTGMDILSGLLFERKLALSRKELTGFVSLFLQFMVKRGDAEECRRFIEKHVSLLENVEPSSLLFNNMACVCRLAENPGMGLEYAGRCLELSGQRSPRFIYYETAALLAAKAGKKEMAFEFVKLAKEAGNCSREILDAEFELLRS